MVNKKNSEKIILIISLLLILGVIALIISKAIRPIKKIETGQETSERVQPEEGKVLSLRIYKENSKIVVLAEPKEKTVSLRAFALQMLIKTKGGMPKITDKDLMTPNVLDQASWSFPIKRLETNGNNIEIGLSGFVVGDPFYLRDKISLAVINLPEDSPVDFELDSVLIDEESTRFLNNLVEPLLYQLYPEKK